MSTANYKSQIFFLSRGCEPIYETVVDSLINKDSKLYNAIIDYSEELSSPDIEILSSHAEGILVEASFREKCAAASIILCAGYLRERELLNSLCREYDVEKDKIFSSKHVRDIRHKKDLIDYRQLKRANDSYAVLFQNKWYALSDWIPSQLLIWADGCFKESRAYARLDPDFSSNKKPSDKIFEAIVYNSDNDWWKNLRVYKGTSKGFISEILESDCATNPLVLKEYKKGFRRLELSCTRDNKGNMTMMIEELQDIVNPTNPNDHYVVGRMIHLDTDAITGSDYKEAIMNHIDIAINLYIGNDANIRLRQNLPVVGQVISTEKRTHLIKFMDLSFCYLPKIARTFFKSEFLVNEWLSTQFEQLRP